MLLHKLYAFAEDRNVTRDSVNHPVRKEADQTGCMDTYVQALLLNGASPNEQTSRQLAIAARWLDRWGNRVRVLEHPSPPRAGAPLSRPLAVDLAGASGAFRAETSQAASSMRYLDVDDLSNTLRKRIALLRKGDSPASLDLGEDVAAQFAEQLLSMLHRHWCEDTQARAQAKRSISGNAGRSPPAWAHRTITLLASRFASQAMPRS